MGPQPSSALLSRDAFLLWLSITTTSHVIRKENTLPSETLAEVKGLSPGKGPSNSSPGETQPLLPMMESGSELHRFKTERTVQGPITMLLRCISVSTAPAPHLALPVVLKASGPETAKLSLYKCTTGGRKSKVPQGRKGGGRDPDSLPHLQGSFFLLVWKGGNRKIAFISTNKTPRSSQPSPPPPPCSRRPARTAHAPRRRRAAGRYGARARGRCWPDGGRGGGRWRPRSRRGLGGDV